MSDAEIDEFLSILAQSLAAVAARAGAHRMTRHFLRDDDLSPAEQAAILDLADADEGRPLGGEAAGRSADASR